MILRILHEYLVRNNVADEKSFVRLNMPIPSEYSHFWTEDIVGFFLLRWYVVTYFVHGNRDQVVEFNKKLHSAFDPVSHDIQRDFFFDSNHLRFHVEKVVEGELSETKHGQFQVTVSF